MLKKWYFALLIASLSLGTIYAFPFLDNTSTAPPSLPDSPQYIRQTITADSTTSRTITWHTIPTDTIQSIEYKIANAEEAFSLEATTKVLATDLGESYLHSITLNNLIPSTTYLYRVGTPNAFSAWYSFTTASTENPSFHALIFPDSQSSDYTVWENTVNAAALDCPMTDFFINMGDLVDNGSSFYQWQAWFNGAKTILPLIPFAPIEGNHEAYSLDWKFTTPDLYLSLFDLPQNGAPNLAGQTYSFDYGDAHFVVLDSQAEELNAYQPNLIANQLPWLAQDLQMTKKKWKIILIHRNLFSYPDTENLNELGKAFMPIFDRYHVDLVFTAHIHSYGRTKPLYQGLPAPKGTVYISTGRAGDKPWEKSLQKPVEVVFDNALAQPNYLSLTVDANQLNVKAIRQDYSLIDEFTLQK